MDSKNSPFDPNATFQNAVSLHQAGKLNEAAALYEQLLARNPKDPQLLTQLGIIVLHLGKVEASINLFGQALKIDPNQPMILINRGIALGILRRFDEALMNFDQAVALAPDLAEAHSNRGNALNELKRFEEALVSFDCAISYGLDYPNIYFNRGNAFQGLKRFEEALNNYDRAIAIQPGYFKAYNSRGLVLKELGRLDEALGSYGRAIALNSDFAESYNHQGIILSKLDRFEEALKSYNQAITLNPDYAEAYNNRGITFYKLKRYDEALASYDRAIEINSDSYHTYSNRGNTLNELKRYEEALASYDRAIALKPDYAEAYSNRGAILKELKRYDEALASYDRAIAFKPDYAEAYSNRGATLKELKRHDEALASYDRAIAFKPDYAEAYSNRGVTLNELKSYDEALASYDRAIAFKADYAEAYSNRGVTLNALKRYDEALASYDRAIDFKPELAEAYSNRGITLNELKHYDEALASYDRAISYKPDLAEVYRNRGITLNDINHHDEALVDYERAIKLRPDIDFMRGTYLHTKMKLCNWHNFNAHLSEITSKIANRKRISTPFEVMALTSSPECQKQSSVIYIDTKFPPSHALAPLPKYPRHNRIRIGYFSADFHNHATMHLMAELFEHHDRSKFEIIAFSFGPNTNDDWRKRAVRAFDRFIDVRFQSDREVALLARSMGIDIAVDLKGLTKDSRTGILAERAAPIQINYLGYPGTMGAEYIDYLIADLILIPEENKRFYLEKIVYLPNSYQVNDTKQARSNKTFTRSDVGLPESSIIYCSFNDNYKILPDIFDVWMRLLQQVEGSVFWLFVSNQTARNNLRLEAEKRGIDSGRLVFAEYMPREDHLIRIQLADLFLDTFPCNAHTTASDALRVGLPLLTYSGESFASRVAASLLNAVGLPGLIMNSLEEYEALALELAINPQRLAQIKQKLLNNLSTALLYDTPLFTKHIEAAYVEMYERYQNDLTPEHIYVVP